MIYQVKEEWKSSWELLGTDHRKFRPSQLTQFCYREYLSLELPWIFQQFSCLLLFCLRWYRIIETFGLLFPFLWKFLPSLTCKKNERKMQSTSSSQFLMKKEVQISSGIPMLRGRLKRKRWRKVVNFRSNIKSGNHFIEYLRKYNFFYSINQTKLQISLTFQVRARVSTFEFVRKSVPKSESFCTSEKKICHWFQSYQRSQDSEIVSLVW